MGILKNPQVLAALITSVMSSLVTILVVYITTKSSNKQAKINSNTIIEQSKSQRNIEAITKNRVEWMQKLKEYMSQYTGIIMHFLSLNKPGAYKEMFKEIVIISNKIRLHLNFIGKEDEYITDKMKEINYLIADIDNPKNKERSDRIDICMCQIELLILYTQIYLKAEWERVKFESENGNTQKFDFHEKFEEYRHEKYDEIKRLENKVEELENEIKELEVKKEENKE